MPSKQSAYTAAVSSMVEDNTKRTTMVVVNTSGAETAYINDESTVSAAQGIPLPPGGNIVMEKALGWSTEKAWWKMGTGAGNLNVYEGFGKLPSPPGSGNGNGTCPTQQDEAEGIAPPPKEMR